MIRGFRRWMWVLVLALVAGSAYGGWRLMKAWLPDCSGGDPQGSSGWPARNRLRDLAALLTWEPDSDEAAYLLGLCEKARGRTQQADQAWGAVPPGSRFAPPSIVGRAAMLVDRGQLAEAERLLTRALSDPRIDGFELRRFLTPLYWQEGRIAEARRLVEANWEVLKELGRGGSHEAIELVRLHIVMGVGTASAESVRNFLDRAERLAPQDERIELGRQPGNPPGAIRRCCAADRRVPASAPRGCPGVAGEAGLGDGDRAGGRRPARPWNICRPPTRARRSSPDWQPGSPPVARTSLPNGVLSSGLPRQSPMEPRSIAWPSSAVREGQPALRGRSARAQGGGRSTQGPVPGALARRSAVTRRSQDGRAGGTTGLIGLRPQSSPASRRSKTNQR